MIYRKNSSAPVTIIRLVVLVIVAGVGAASGQVPDASPTPKADSSPSPKQTPHTGKQDQKLTDTSPMKPNPDDMAPLKNDPIDDQDKKQKKEKRGSLIIAPIPINSSTFGAGLIIGAGYVFKLNKEDKLSPPSTIGAAAAFTNNGTRGFGLGGRFIFAENKYQASFAIGKGRARYEFFGIGLLPGRSDRSVLIRQRGSIFFAEFMRNVGKNIFIGPRYQYRKLTVSVGGMETPNGFTIPQIDLKSTTAAIGFHIMRDLRDSSFYPTKGSVWDVKVDFFRKALGSNRDYQTFSAAYNGYHTIGKGQVLAYRAKACSVSDRAPFFDLCLYGGNDIRGYSTGRFQNNRLFATQVEYRKELKWRLGLVGFGGIGGVADGWNEFRLKKLLPGAGVGLRFNLDKTNHINYRVDLGFGRTGYTLSLSVTEAF